VAKLAKKGHANIEVFTVSFMIGLLVVS